ncbi:MAG: 3-oxoacyl-ACP synthase III family protein [Pseudonocardiaceae bacterium]
MDIGAIGIGAYVPETIIDNETISGWTGASETWIAERTGVVERRYADPKQATSDLAFHACLLALAQHPEVEAGNLELIVVGTSTPDQPQPSTAAILQDKLGLRNMPVFDLNAVCTSFLYALSVAHSWLAHRRPDGHALVVGADRYSTLMNRSDRRTVTLFGDGAGAMLLGPVPEGFGVRASRLAAHGEHRELVEVIAGGTREPLDINGIATDRHLFRMNGRAVKEYALQSIATIAAAVLDDAHLTVNDISHFVFHQGNPRLVEAIRDELELDPARVPIVAGHYGNTAASSIPLTLAILDREQRLIRGQHILLAGIGGGMTAGAAVLTWH